MQSDDKKNYEHGDHDQFDPWGKSCADTSEKLLIEGPRTRLGDLKRVTKIFFEFLRGFHAFRRLGPSVTFFGSARFREDHRYYDLARVTARLLARYGFSIITGGGPGLMEACNRGAKDVKGVSVGCNITLPVEQKPNQYLDLFVEFDHFYVRKVMLLRYSCAFLVLPGGFGTLDEVFETITLIQTKKITDFPIVVMGVDFWSPLRHFIYHTLLKNSTISEHDLRLLHFTDDPADALSYIVRYADTKSHYSKKQQL